jgi:hypothetical protein
LKKDRRLLWTCAGAFAPAVARNMVARAFRHQSAILPDFAGVACAKSLAEASENGPFPIISMT